VTKHQCGTCSYFQQSPNPKHGWCTHPDRREATSMRILVRAGELRCRNDWGQDLWQLRDPGDQVLEVVMADDVSRDGTEPMAARRIPPPVDRVIAPAIHPVSPVAATQSERTTLVSDDINRELVRRAREQFRDRQARSSYAITGQNQSHESDEPLVISNDVIPPTAEPQARAVRDDVIVADSGPLQSALPEVFVPEVKAAALGLTESEESPAWEYQISNPWRTASGVPESTEPDFLDTPEPESLPDLAWDEPDYQSAAAAGSSRRRSTEHEVPGAAAAIDLDSNDVAVAGTSRDDIDEAVAWDPPLPSHRESDVLVGAAGVTPDHVWAELPRCCGTCKDFRPASGGRRGWCTNQWAFKHRRMVDANDRPCETSIGHWWVAADSVWQGDIDLDAYAKPTPLMDKYLGANESPDSALIRRRGS
jgi:hypothetical protein